jgi:peptidoglycan/xylan/chitin deacetylase (PgdA/CDA1 family)
MLLSSESISYLEGGKKKNLQTKTLEQKRAAYNKFRPLTLKRGPDSESRLLELFNLNGVDPKAALNRVILDWHQARELSRDPLVEIGCHTVTHPVLANLDYSDARQELAQARGALEEKLGVRVSHLSYPYGTKKECSVREFQIARDLGFQTATTTRRGNVFPEHKDHLTALPRVNIPGTDSASLRFIRKCLFGESPWPRYAPALVTD